MKNILTLLICLNSFIAFGQATGAYIKDPKTGCKVWVDEYAPDNSITWSGACKSSYADGQGTLTWYTSGKEIAQYTGVMKKGKPNGKGKYHNQWIGESEGTFINGVMQGQGTRTFATGLKLDGYYIDDEFVGLGEPEMKQLQKHTTALSDSTDIYVNDGNSKALFYYTIAPKGLIKGTIVLLPSSGENAESVLSCNKKLIQLAIENNILILALSVNNDKGLDDDKLALAFLNTVFKEAAEKYQAPKHKFIVGGFSGGGMLALRYAEMSRDNSNRTSIIPVAVFGVDPPVDLARLYNTAKEDLLKNSERTGLSPGKMNGLREAKWIVEENDKTYGGSPDQYPAKYIKYSMYSRSEKDGGNAKYLSKMPVRVYSDPDILWALKERNRDYYDMNAADLSSMINFLNLNGNKEAEFIPAIGKGYRLDGTRHPHSWSIVEPSDCLNWASKILGQ